MTGLNFCLEIIQDILVTGCSIEALILITKDGPLLNIYPFSFWPYTFAFQGHLLYTFTGGIESFWPSSCILMDQRLPWFMTVHFWWQKVQI